MRKGGIAKGDGGGLLWGERRLDVLGVRDVLVGRRLSAWGRSVVVRPVPDAAVVFVIYLP